MLDKKKPMVSIPLCQTRTQLETTLVQLLHPHIQYMLQYNLPKHSLYLTNINSNIMEQHVREIINEQFRTANAPIDIRVRSIIKYTAVLSITFTKKQPYVRQRKKRATFEDMFPNW